jgi:hypothetical protein
VAGGDVDLAAPTPVREYAGVVVFSTYDAGRFFLTVQRPGGEPERLPVPPRDVAFDVDIGPDTRRNPELVYSRCADDRQRRECDIYALPLADGAHERPVRNANAAESDVEPTLWRGRIAWTRLSASGPVVYTKTLTAPRALPSRRLPGVPQRRCGDTDRVCGPTGDRQVEDLELYGRRLAEVVRYTCRGCSGISSTEVRLVDRRAGAVEQIAFLTTGLSGQSWIGPSFFADRLAFSKACLGDPAACQAGKGGPYRVRYARGIYEKGPGPGRVDGFADTGEALYEVVGCSQVSGEPLGTATCRLTRTDPPAYARVKAPRR